MSEITNEFFANRTVKMMQDMDQEIIADIRNNATIYSDLFWSNQEKLYYKEKQQRQQVYFPKEGF